MSKRSSKPSMKVMENLLQNNYGMWRLCCIFLMLHPGLKIMPFKLTGYSRLRQKTENSSEEAEERKIYGFTAPNEVISTKTNEIAGYFSS